MRTILPKYQNGTEGKKKMPVFTKKLKEAIRSIYEAFRSAGLDDNSISGILGNALTESSLTEDSVSKDKLYWGMWLNSVPIKDEIIKHYGDYSLASQAKYVRDWIEGAKHVKRNPHFVTYNGRYKKTGYATPSEAGKAFTRLYERPVIYDKNGNIIGYNKEDERIANSELMALYIANNFGIKETTTPDGNKVMTFGLDLYIPKPYESSSKFKLPIHVDYPLSGSEAPESISSWNGADSPSAAPTIPSILKLNNEERAKLNFLPEVTSIGKYKTRLLPRMPLLSELMSAFSPQQEFNRLLAESLGLDEFLKELDFTSDLFLFKNGKSPIRIKPENRGKLTRLKKRTGKSEAELYRTGSAATRKMITFARNVREWKH